MRMPISRHVRMIRTAISPRLAMRIFLNMAVMLLIEATIDRPQAADHAPTIPCRWSSAGCPSFAYIGEMPCLRGTYWRSRLDMATSSERMSMRRESAGSIIVDETRAAATWGIG